MAGIETSLSESLRLAYCFVVPVLNQSVVDAMELVRYARCVSTPFSVENYTYVYIYMYYSLNVCTLIAHKISNCFRTIHCGVAANTLFFKRIHFKKLLLPPSITKNR